GWQQSDIAGALMIRPVLGAFVPSPVGIKDVEFESLKFKVYPNPASDELKVESLTFKEGLTVSIYDILGREVIQNSKFKIQNSIDVSSLNKGIFFLVLKENNNIVHQQKII